MTENKYTNSEANQRLLKILADLIKQHEDKGFQWILQEYSFVHPGQMKMNKWEAETHHSSEHTLQRVQNVMEIPW